MDIPSAQQELEKAIRVLEQKPEMTKELLFRTLRAEFNRWDELADPSTRAGHWKRDIMDQFLSPGRFSNGGDRRSAQYMGRKQRAMVEDIGHICQLVPQDLDETDAEDFCVTRVAQRWKTMGDDSAQIHFSRAIRMAFRQIRAQSLGAEGGPSQLPVFEINEENISETVVVGNPHAADQAHSLTSAFSELQAAKEWDTEVVHQIINIHKLRISHQLEMERLGVKHREAECERAEAERQRQHERDMWQLSHPVRGTGTRAAARPPINPLERLLHEPWRNWPCLTGAVGDLAKESSIDLSAEELCRRVHAACQTSPPTHLLPARGVLRERRPRAVAPSVLLYVQAPDADRVLAALAQHLWQALRPGGAAPAPAPPPPPPPGRKRGRAGEPSLSEAALAPFPTADHPRLEALLLQRFVHQPALRRWRGIVWRRELRGEQEDVTTALDMDHDPLLPALHAWLRACSCYGAEDPDCPAPPSFGTCGLPVPELQPHRCWARLQGTATHQVLHDQLRRLGLAAPRSTLADEDHHLAEALEPERSAHLEQHVLPRGPWLRFSAIGELLGWDARLQACHQLIPLLALPLLEPPGPTEAWRQRKAEGVWHYHLGRALDGLRAAAVVARTLPPELPLGALVVDLNCRAGFAGA